MPKIDRIFAREILDSRGNPTVEVDILMESTFGRSAVPSGASTGSKEAVEIRDGDARYLGQGVQKAVQNVNSVIAPSAIGKDFYNQKEFDQFLIDLDGTKNKSKLGANSILACSLSFARAIAYGVQRPLFASFLQPIHTPLPLCNVINGGEHANSALDIQEIMIVPHGFDTFKEAIRASSEIFHKLGDKLKALGHSTAVGDEGGYAPNIKGYEEAFDLILESVDDLGYSGKVGLALDIAASELFENGKYNFVREGVVRNKEEMITFYKNMVDKYPVVSLEDPFDESDWESWTLLTKELGSKVQIVGDDLFVTNKELLSKGISEKAANSILIKPNQIGTVSETIETIELAKANGLSFIISHRSGETEDPFIADFAIGMQAMQIKSGSLSRSERIAKYNQILRIEESLHLNLARVFS